METGKRAKHNPIAKMLGDVYPGEGTRVFLMLLNIFFILVAYYVIKVVREPLILSTPGGAQWKSYGAGAQAALLMLYVPLYSWFCAKVDRLKLVLGINLFFLINIEIFSLAVKGDVPFIGVAFFIWVGIFSLSVIAQFWSWANDLHAEEEGKRLFPIIAIGGTLGSPLGSKMASILFDTGLPAHLILQVSAALLLLSTCLYWVVQKKYVPRSDKSAVEPPKLSRAGGFQLVLKSHYLLLFSGLLLLLNLVNTTGEFILSSRVVETADQISANDPALDKKAFIGTFYGNFFFVVNVAALILQAFFVSRFVKYLGIAGVVLMLPLVSLGAYSMIAAGVGFAVLRWAKTAENATDYSVMNTARQMLWLPTNREEKYKAKQAIDTFIVRIGDLLSAALVFAGLNWLQLSGRGFAAVNVGITVAWIFVATLLLREYKKLSQQQQQVMETV